MSVVSQNPMGGKKGVTLKQILLAWKEAMLRPGAGGGDTGGSYRAEDEP